jgi:hypothetical protein
VIENLLVPKPLYARDSEKQIGNIQKILYFRYTQDGFGFLTAIMLHRLFIQFASYILKLQSGLPIAILSKLITS